MYVRWWQGTGTRAQQTFHLLPCFYVGSRAEILVGPGIGETLSRVARNSVTILPGVAGDEVGTPLMRAGVQDDLWLSWRRA